MGLLTCSLFLLLSVAANAFDYCSISADNTVCKYPDAGPGKACKDYQSKPITDTERTNILAKHNDLRNNLAQGKVDGFPSASDIKTMSWDDELAMIAQRWADQCTFKHDTNRSSQKGGAGQNLAIKWSTKSTPADVVPQVQGWYDEIKDYKYTNGSFTFDEKTGHFTQLIWSSSNRLGCGRSFYTDDSQQGMKASFLVCNYGPPGNVGGKPLYKAGKPCDGCTCSSSYASLCQ